MDKRTGSGEVDTCMTMTILLDEQRGYRPDTTWSGLGNDLVGRAGNVAWMWCLEETVNLGSRAGGRGALAWAGSVPAEGDRCLCTCCAGGGVVV